MTVEKNKQKFSVVINGIIEKHYNFYERIKQ